VSLPPRVSIVPPEVGPQLERPPAAVSERRAATNQAFWWTQRRKLGSALALALVLTLAIWAWPNAERARLFAPPAATGASAREVQPSTLGPALAEASAPEQPVVAPPAAEPDAQASAHKQALARAGKLVLQGNRLRKRGKLRAAHDSYQRSLALLPDFPRALSGMTQLYLAQHEPAQALETVQALLRVRPRFPDDQRLLGDVYMAAGQPDDARAAWRRAASQGNALARARLRKYRR
jgi:tetratricopeptide (TPR) repeat protein